MSRAGFVRGGFGLYAALLLGVATARADDAPAANPGPSAAAALIAVRDADPLELARIVARAGDDAILPLLLDPEPPAVRLAAIRAARWLAEPERALPSVIASIASRDSDLAPAAARAALAIAERLDADELARRELTPTQLAPARDALLQAARQPGVRPDLCLLALSAAAQLEADGVPPPAPSR